MRTTIVRKLLCAALCCVPLMASAEEVVQTRIGELTFTHDFAAGYPTDATIDKLFDEIDFQRASQVYIWAIPLVSMAQWQYAYNVHARCRKWPDSFPQWLRRYPGWAYLQCHYAVRAGLH